MTRQTQSLDRLFAPQSIAVVGASNTAGKAGAVPITLLRSQGYGGTIYPIHPTADTVQGLPAWRSLGDLDEAVDLAIVAVPAQHVLQTLQSAREGQLANAVIFTSGFAETGARGLEQQQTLQALAAARGMRLLGPNCLGFMNIPRAVYATFSPAPLVGAVARGDIGMVTQSGAFGAYAYSMARERGIGLSFWASTGNESDVGVADCLQWLVDDPNTRVIMAYMEGCKDGDALKRALRAAHDAGKPVVITKIGRTDAGAKAAASHTAALAGNDAVYEALFRQYGVYRARDMEEFFTLGHSLSVWRTARHAPRSLGVVTISGGVGALMADEADDHDLALPALDAQAQARLCARIPFASAANPVDVTGQALTDPGVIQATCLDMLASGQFGALAIFLAAAGSSESFWPHVQDLVQTLHARHPGTPLAICALLSALRRKILERYGCAVFEDPSRAVQTLGKLLGRQATLPVAAVTMDTALPMDGSARSGALSESQSLALLSAIGIPVASGRVVASAEQASAVAAQLGVPVVMKIASADIPHKSDVGGVRLNVAGADQVQRAYQDIMASAARHRPEARIDGVLVAPMIRSVVECILGVQCDPVFGPVVMFGLGGVFVEIFKDVSFRLAPFDETEAHAMIRETRAAQLLQGARGGVVADVDALAQALARLSQFAYAQRDRITSMDINPLGVLPKGQGVIALDAVVVCA